LLSGDGGPSREGDHRRRGRPEGPGKRRRIAHTLSSRYSEPTRTHPLYQLAAHVLRHGSYRRSGKPAHFSDRLSRALEDVCDEAVERLIAEAMTRDVED
jgi:hypothetical protein